ncbi:Lrp/AsnC family transcriptional regulator [uncultured Paraglaciecola sp.]|uniref:Lrp/AsnC family transcriptional regulator n=1 Tax=uncultured Paraglaciecola sp. TaxID=1765024 RepID=UPI002604C0CE|nr:Lrp/AsnC family transcriptional regulator [uncultured Paraglaciecola sp.]
MLDKKDRLIVEILQRNGRISMSDLAQEVNLSDTPCLRRVKKLEQAGVIEGYQATLNRQAFNLNVLVYAFVRLSANSDKLATQFEQTVASLDQVLECSVVTGAYDYLLKIIAEDLEDYEGFVKKSLGRIDDIATIESTVVLKQTFSRNVLPIKMN